MRRALLVVVACALAFVAGRSIPRAAPGPAPDVLAVDGATPTRGPDEAGAPASLAAAPVATTGQPMTPAEVPLPRGDVVVKPPGDPAASAESRVPPAWLDAVRAEPTRANHVKQLLIQAMHVRVDPVAIRECLREDGISGGLILRFEVDVESETDELRVGEARFVEALEGPPVTEAARRCIAQQLAGDELHPGDDLLDGYVGPVDYQLAINVPAAR